MNRTITGSTHSTSAIGLRAAVAASAIALVATLASCGGQHSSTASNASTSSQVEASSQQSGPVVAMPAMSTPPAGNSQRSRVISLGDSLPPEVTASVEDSVVRAGEVVEIIAQGSDDVSQVGLSDGIGRMQLFTRDPASNVWHVLYRVPLKTNKDKLALSVTALNDVNRWRRVWVFVQLNHDKQNPELHDDNAEIFHDDSEGEQ